MPLIRRNAAIALVIFGLNIPLTIFVYVMIGNPLKVLLFCYSSIFFTFGIGSVSSLTIALYLRLNSMANFVRLEIQSGNSKNRRSTRLIIKTLAEMYQKLSDSSDDICLCYGVQMMLGFGLMFFYTLFTCFSAYTDMVNNGKLADETISSTAACLYYNLFLATVILSCCRVTNEVE